MALRVGSLIALVSALVLGCGGRSVSYESESTDAGAPGSPSAGASGSAAGGSSSGGSDGSSGGSSTNGGSSSGGANNGGSSTNGGSSSGGSVSMGGSPAAGGTDASGGTNASGGSAGAVDANCYPGLAVSGAECTQHCSVPCGFADLGTRTCTCTGGYYSSCHCPRPSDYEGAPTAPPCDTPDGRAIPLRNTSCDVEWAECIGNDPVEGSIPRGCACLRNPLAGGRLQWFCGSTNRWFSAE